MDERNCDEHRAKLRRYRPVHTSIKIDVHTRCLTSDGRCVVQPILVHGLDFASGKRGCPEEVERWRISILSRRSVPKEQLKIARHFNAGKGLEKSSPAGTAE